MCGICGIVYSGEERRVQRDTLAQMNTQIVHRGPDDDGFFVEGNVGLAMRRLSIIDIRTGQQPISNEDESLWIVYNGEIYNHRELRSKLEARGHCYRTKSDTETIVHLYEEYGSECVQHLRGMFAFAIWDRRSRRLFIARDRLGIKPLYYFYDGKKFIFGSEIKAILAHPGIKAEFDQSTLAEYLAFGYIAGTETLFTGIRKLLPGNRLEIDDSGEIKIESYWDLSVRADSGSHPRTHYVKTYRELLEECVASHLMSDVPLGVFLSGGLDSSAVAALTSKIRGEQIETFSVGYGEEAYSELPYAREVAQHIGSLHHEVQLRRHEFFESLPKLIWHEDEPIVWPSSVSLYFVARLARDRVTVVLTGEGSDETLAGYTRYAWTLQNSRMDRVYRSAVPSALRQLVRRGISAGPLGSSLHRKLEHTVLVRDGASWASLSFHNFYSAFSEATDLLTASAHATAGDAYRGSMQHWEHSPGDLLHRLLYTDIKTYLVELLMKQDQMSMAASIESRVPFLDHVLVEFAATIPAEFSVHGLAGKHILKTAVEDLLPKSIVHRQKMGFPTPWASWLSGSHLDQLESMLLEPRTTARGLFKREVIQRLFAEHRAQRRDHGNRIWRLLNLEIWMRVLLDGESPPRDLEIQENMAALPARPAASV
ncbi:MAG: asparagine synthase (glutamine-hydrolyzing) [Acidobacteria bacterium]|nr:MAG: asparagine synthase (glutamine-hydrolyzing) [Acidobacteriota bacterium]